MSKHLSMDIRVPIELDNPSIMRFEEKCIKCGMCRDICRDYIGVHGTYSLKDTNDTAVCINCGQCANVCPASSITEKYEYQQIAEAVKNKDKIVIFSTSPSVRVALGEEFGMEKGSLVEGKMVSLLRALGGNYILDTNFAADLTIVEEASELIQRITTESKPLPQFTSCCPAWVKYAEIYHPEILPNLSTARSPIGMQGPTIKTYFAKKMNIDPEKIVNVAVTPCTAKKFEIRRDEMKDAGKKLGIEDMRDMDYVITTRELALWAKEAGVDFKALEESSFDKVMGESTGAGIIFGNTGGVMEAALRTAYEYVTHEKAPADLFELKEVRGMEGIKEAGIKVGDLTVNVAVIYGTENADKVIEKVKNDKETSSTEENSNVQVATIDGVTLYTIQVASIGEGQDLKSVEEKLTSSKIPYSVVEVDGVKKVQTYSSFNEKVTRENLDDVRKVFNDAFISELSVPVLSLEYTSKYSYIEGISSSLNSLMASYKEEAEFWEGSKGDVDLKEYNNILTKRLDIVEKIQENAEKIDYTEMNIFKENLIKYAKNVKDNINQSSKNANEDNSYLSKSLLLSSIQEYYPFINSIKTS